MVSALPQRAENQLHVSLMENYPGTLEALGEPIRQVWDAEMRDAGCGGAGEGLGRAASRGRVRGIRADCGSMYWADCGGLSRG